MPAHSNPFMNPDMPLPRVRLKFGQAKNGVVINARGHGECQHWAQSRLKEQNNGYTGRRLEQRPCAQRPRFWCVLAFEHQAEGLVEGSCIAIQHCQGDGLTKSAGAMGPLRQAINSATKVQTVSASISKRDNPSSTR